MAVITYEIPSGRIVHETKVDFSYRSVQKPIHIVQYDKQLPIIAVSLYVSGKTYTLPANMDVNVKFGKRDKTFVYKSVLGCNVSRNIVYFEVDEQMSLLHGPVNPILELSFIDGGEPKRAGSSPIAIEIDRNPIQESDIESTIEYVDLNQAVIDAQTSASEAEVSASEAEASASEALASKNAALASKNAAALSASDALASEQAALASKNAAALSASDALASEQAALASEQAALGYRNELNQLVIDVADAQQAVIDAQTSASEALASKNTAALSASEALASEQASLASKNAAALSASDALASEQAALASKNAAALSESEALASKNAAALSASEALGYRNEVEQIIIDGVTAEQVGAEPAFTKNTAFNKNFGTTAGTVAQGNDSRLSDARTPTSHAHGNVTNDGKIGTTAGLIVKTGTGGVLEALTAGSSGQFLKHDGTWGTPPDNQGVTSVTGTSPVASSGGATPVISLAANYGDTQNPYASKTAKYFLAAPNAANGAPTFREIVASDIPTLNQSTTGNAATATKLATARDFTIGPTAKSFDGSAVATWTLAEIGINVVTTCPTGVGTAGRVNIYTGAACAEKFANWLYFET